EAALTQMVLHCSDEFDPTIEIKKVTVRTGQNGYIIAVYLDMRFGAQLSGSLHDFQEYVIDNIERYTGIMIEKVDIKVDQVSMT
ncbi:MAG: Asp23/Gls24 family envelope stress response protein, partial [Spirochaetales bacterium]|nr:Asp23/Gls24 family envelope stress response protein [Spirochaetales bacterium]